MWELDHKEGWALKNFWTVVLEKTLESLLDSKEIQLVNPKGNQSWVFIGKTDVEAETPILWPPDGKTWLIGNDPDAGKDWRQEEKGMPEDEIVGWHHWFYGHESEQTLGVGDGQGGLVCCSSWGHKELDATELNWAFFCLSVCVCQFLSFPFRVIYSNLPVISKMDSLSLSHPLIFLFFSSPPSLFSFLCVNT